jgi:hypothetical protein
VTPITLNRLRERATVSLTKMYRTSVSGVFRRNDFWFRGLRRKPGQRFAVCGGNPAWQIPRAGALRGNPQVRRLAATTHEAALKRITPQVVAVQLDQVEGIEEDTIVSAVVPDEIEGRNTVSVARRDESGREATLQHNADS